MNVVKKHNLNKFNMIAEWERQSAVLMAYPHKHTDWNQSDEMLKNAREQFNKIIYAILEFQPLYLLVYVKDDSKLEIEKVFAKFIDAKKLLLIMVEFNDTWIRDYGVISTRNQNGEIMLHNFIFNGWGEKYEAKLDNLVNAKLAKNKILKHKMLNHRFVLEGGSIDVNSRSEMLSSTQCLLEKHRNPKYTRPAIINKLCNYLGVKKLHLIEHGYLRGDDTDSHIDTLARFIDDDTIVYMGCDDEADEHFKELKLMEEELKSFTNQNNKAYKLIKLPLPNAIYDDKMERLPASYVNFLFINDALLVPIYNDKKDEVVLNILQNNLKNRKIIGVDCSILIKWHGSLHCATMQLH